ncbi:MAG TPA: VOC family protein [Syntrophales bacterium]|nr:VOC family protein [Syntrophales bacterium]
MKKNSVAHFEIYADDPDKLGQFYTSLFDWTIEHMPEMDYRWVKTVETDAKGMPSQAGGINGGILKRPAGYEGRAWINYVNVESLEASIDRAKKLGATVMKGKTPVPGMGWFAMLIDPQGNPFAIWQTDAKAK